MRGKWSGVGMSSHSLNLWFAPEKFGENGPRYYVITKKSSVLDEERTVDPMPIPDLLFSLIKIGVGSIC